MSRDARSWGRQLAPNPQWPEWPTRSNEIGWLQSKKMADALKLQLNIRQNAEELQDILQGLNSWEDEMKAKDNELRHSKIINKQVWH